MQRALVWPAGSISGVLQSMRRRVNCRPRPSDGSVPLTRWAILAFRKLPKGTSDTLGGPEAAPALIPVPTQDVAPDAEHCRGCYS